MLHEEHLAAVWPDESMGIGAMIASKLLLMHRANAQFCLIAGCSLFSDPQPGHAGQGVKPGSSQQDFCYGQVKPHSYPPLTTKKLLHMRTSSELHPMLSGSAFVRRMLACVSSSLQSLVSVVQYQVMGLMAYVVQVVAARERESLRGAAVHGDRPAAPRQKQ